MTTDDRAQSEVIGVVLLVAVVLLGTLTMLVTGLPALEDSRDHAEVEHATQALGQFDARTGMTALHRTGVQHLSLGDSGSGRYALEPEAGWLRIVHHNYTGAEDEVVYNQTLGALTYRNGATTLAYQGGGVWRADRHGSVMLSPPEFHYQEETLVLPVIALRGDEHGVAGSPSATVAPVGETERAFPNATADDADGTGAPYDATDRPYVNPIRGGSVNVTVHSQFYEGWATFFRERTAGRVHVDHDARTTTVELVAPRVVGFFGMPSEGNSIDVRGLEPSHALDEFTITLRPDRSDAADFDNLQWTLYADEGRQQLEVHLRLAGPDDDPTTPCKEQHVGATVYYSDRNGNPYHGWQNDRAYRTTCFDADDDGVEDEVRLHANLSGDTPLSLQALQSDDVIYFNTRGSDLASDLTLDGHGAAWEPASYDAGDAETVDRLLNHYFAELGPDFDLVVDDKNSDTVEEEDSYGVLEYDGEGRVTFMHVTTNGIRVELET